jgi:hypothetical protein
MKTIRKSLAAALLFAALFALSAPAAAAGDGAYLAATNTYYLNPDTGVTDDGGTQNAALGEGMCRSVVYKNALVERDGGKIHLTVRLQLMSNMQDFRLYVQSAPGGAYSSVRPRAMQEDVSKDTADYRFEIPSVTSYVSWEMYVIPMGRDVKFYMNVSDALTEGGGDFVVSVKPAAPSATPPSATPEITPPPSTAPSAAPSATPEASPSPEASAAPEPSADSTPAPEASAPPSETPEPSATAAAVETEPSETPEIAPSPEPAPESDRHATLYILLAVVLLLAAAVLTAFLSKKRRRGK